MLSEIERIFPTNCSNVKVDIAAMAAARKKRSELFNEQYFTNKFWDIILLLYSHEINELPIDSAEIANHLEIDQSSVLRYLTALENDDIVCAYDLAEDDCFDLARDKLSLTRSGFENAGIIVQQVRKILTSMPNV
ncbi:hypothetical protein [Sphingorhabdus sp. 109]|jgi:DNA-binding MarR family transcriptional regulator|uniref:hypothetical protein n=1 Tax=Sphingorhabdus sp. 109 TaxID=2653173 RepID=UPI0012F46374|nr:hypothetical protein [Sphingorhabdus sp. 109]VWX58532.1 conserved hypothetical protein [Sphingorhabdus sp. 109]